MSLFPSWAKELGIEAQLVGRDLSLEALPGAFRELLEEIRGDARVVGAVVTSHKLNLLRHGRDLFSDLDPMASLCGEVGCISKSPRGLIGHAIDPVSTRRSLEGMVGPAYWEGSDAEVLCLGAGGAGLAITVALINLPRPPARITVSDTRPEALEHVRVVQGSLSGPTDLRLELVSKPEENDALINALPRGSLIINATGLGKDLPGSPLTDRAVFPARGIAWDLNYRGELLFLDQARRHPGTDELRVEDGWQLFLHGWSEGLSRIFGRAIALDLLP
jgi:shikimate 5-dehydrogenase